MRSPAKSIIGFVTACAFVGFVVPTAYAGCSDESFLEAEKIYAEALKEASPERRIELLEKAFSVCPEHGGYAGGYYTLGKLYYDRGDAEKAFEWLKEADRFKAALLQRSPDDLADVNKLLGRIYKERGDLERSLIHLNIYRALAGRDRKLEEDLIRNSDGIFSVIYSPGTVMEILSSEKGASDRLEPKLNRLEVYFDFGRAELDDAAKRRLDGIGEALRDKRFSDRVIMVEGHTDVTGDADANLRLGRRRAKAAAAYLQRIVGGGGVSFKAISKGESDPAILREGHPQASYPVIDRFNRRVVMWNGGRAVNDRSDRIDPTSAPPQARPR